MPVYHQHLSSSSFTSRSRFPSASLDTNGVQRPVVPPNASILLPNHNPTTKGLCFDETKERISKLFHKVDLSVSPYDTAWLAMVPSPHSSRAPRFPQCVNWLLDNQRPDGSWALPHHSPLLLKDVLLSTLASVLALKKWAVAEQHITNGLRFIELNFAALTDNTLHSPVGFDIIFPGMLEYANALDVKFGLQAETIQEALLYNRDMELKRSKESKAYLGYVSEGLGRLQNWENVMRFQRKNGSLFNSPSTTAAAFTHLQNADCLKYLHSVLDKLGNAVPTVYPLDIYVKLYMVDNIERLGVSRHFRDEIANVLDETYRYWLQEEEEIFMDAATCAIAFRLLRKNGYDVSSDPLTKFQEEEFNGHLKDTDAVLELYRATEMVILSDESGLKKQNLWSKRFLKQKLTNGSSSDLNRINRHIYRQVEDVLKFPFHGDLERSRNRRNIENFSEDNTRVLKTSYCSLNLSNKDFLTLALEDFNLCQSIHREEVAQLERWVMENKLDKLKFARQKAAYCYFSAAATLPSPELNDARMSWAKNGVLTTVVDDFFDVGGSIEEMKDLIRLVEKWDVNLSSESCSEQVQIIFSALHSTVCELGDKALAFQARSVTGHIVEIWLKLLNSMWKEAEWSREMSVPTIEEYMANGYVSFALGPIVLPALYFVGPKLSEAVAKHSELQHLFKLMSTCGRLLNDIQSFERESKDGKLNVVSLHMIHGSKDVSKEVAVAEIKRLIDTQRRELLRLVVKGQDSRVPKACKELFWKMNQVLHFFYAKDDGFTSNELARTVEAILYKPVSVNAV